MNGYKSLCDAIASGDLKALRRRVVADRAAARHWKPIMDAAFAGRVDMVTALLDAGADPNVVAGTPGRHTPLIRVMQRHATIPRHEGHDAVIAALLGAGADPDLIGGPHAFGPLAYAAMGGTRAFVEVLTESGAKVDLHLSAMLYDRSRLRRFLRPAGAANTRDARNRTPLHYVAMSGMWRLDDVGAAPALECAKLLLAANVELDAVESLGESEEPSAERGALGKEPSAERGALGKEPSAERAALGKEPSAERAALGKDPSAERAALGKEPSAERAALGKEAFKATALWRVVAWQGFEALARLLLEAGADPKPAVFAAAFEGRVELLEALNDYSVDWNLEHKGRTPLIELMYFKRPAALAWLLAHGADPNRRDNDGRTALHYAVMQGSKPADVAALISAGARPDIRDAQGKIADDYRRANKRPREKAPAKGPPPKKAAKKPPGKSTRR